MPGLYNPPKPAPKVKFVKPEPATPGKHTGCARLNLTSAGGHRYTPATFHRGLKPFGNAYYLVPTDAVPVKPRRKPRKAAHPRRVEPGSGPASIAALIDYLATRVAIKPAEPSVGGFAPPATEPEPSSGSLSLGEWFPAAPALKAPDAESIAPPATPNVRFSARAPCTSEACYPGPGNGGLLLAYNEAGGWYVDEGKGFSATSPLSA